MIFSPRLAARAALALLVLSLAGCGCPEPSADVDTSREDPSFSWPDGNAYQLVVTGPDGAYWSLQCATGQNCFSPPLPYGDVPDDAVEIVSARQLDRGEYEVVVCAVCEDAARCGPATPFEIE